ncbi:substrate-binding domain-containing protein [Sorangium sp. So ce124]|uniref:substrate-binding domain-containing protein n=1 Tax=Sorangium sp. So ce124 TaxID=3133280 RepID=UPI003F6172A9
MKAKGIIIVGFLIAVAVVLFLTTRDKQTAQPDVVPAALSASAAAPPPPAPATEISMLYSSEKQEWIEAALADFKKEHPEISLRLKAMGSIDAAQAIVEGSEKPTIFSPADSLVQNLLMSDWQTKYKTELFAASGDDAPQPIVITPLVFVIWEDRANALLKASRGEISWQAIHKAVKSNEGWPAVGGQPAWGFVKLGHTDPTRSNSGLQALLLMTLDHYKKTSGLAVGDLLNPKYQAFIGEIEKGVPRFETSTGTFMTDMVRFGPSKYDIAVVYENLAIAQLENAQGRWGNLKVYYPATTLWSDHPIAVLQADWVTPAQKQAAGVWIRYLKSRPVQEKALAYGFRPADTSVPLKTASATNPFTRLTQHGVKIEIPPVAQVPDGQVVKNLMMMWTRVVGK